MSARQGRRVGVGLLVLTLVGVGVTAIASSFGAVAGAVGAMACGVTVPGLMRGPLSKPVGPGDDDPGKERQHRLARGMIVSLFPCGPLVAWAVVDPSALSWALAAGYIGVEQITTMSLAVKLRRDKA